jgi:Bacterial regulatory protein, arsR family.
MGDEYEKIWFWVFVGSRGGLTRMKIMNEILKNPLNMHQLAKKLNLDYKTIEHHVRVLIENDLIVNPKAEKYGSLLFPSSIALVKRKYLEELLKSAGEKS